MCCVGAVLCVLKVCVCGEGGVARVVVVVVVVMLVWRHGK